MSHVIVLDAGHYGKYNGIDEISRQIAEKLAPVIAEVMDTEQGFQVLTRKSGNDRNDDGVMNDNYYGILHYARQEGAPALILEHSFHTNKRMTNWLLDDGNLDKLARAEAAVVAEYFGMKKTGSFDAAETANASKNADTTEHIAVAYPDDTVEQVKLYRVQVGAFSKLENAKVMRDRVINAGFDAYITG